MDSAKITFYPSKITSTVPTGITVLDAARRLGVNLESPCSGNGKCGKDLVQIRVNNTLDTVLACKTTVETDLEIIVPTHEKQDGLKIVEGFYGENEGALGLNPLVWKAAMRNGRGHCSTNVYLSDSSYGVALDIGTTTLVASLVCLNTGAALGSSSILNPLVHYGHDVMSRIKYSVVQKDGLFRMHRELISAVNLLIGLLCSDRGVSPEHIYHVVAAGNTTMQHIFLNKEIKGIGEYPYRAETLDVVTIPAKDLSLNASQHAVATAFPSISAYIGGDIVSGLLAIRPESCKSPAIFLDIGTNGEVVLFMEDKMVATSTAAGPCFEGMTISSGMRAGEGAIEHAVFEDELTLEVIGNTQPRGICGSGLLDIISELLRVGLINASGRLTGKEGNGVSGKYSTYLYEKDKKRYFRLADNVSISQEDIRQVQLAKAAIRAGVEILLTTCGISPDELKTVIIAGAFGYHLKEQSLFRTGFLPATKNAKLLYVGNSSLEGAVRMLLDKELIDESVHIARSAQVVELSQNPDFESTFVREMHFT
ncbi:MAG TPA: ASKHA domain-containing protein [Candidatus Brocadiaceae bacterium]|nr:ASKHA domain-containing protein [Candidatus Brocadiaceae bacterium]